MKILITKDLKNPVFLSNDLNVVKMYSQFNDQAIDLITKLLSVRIWIYVPIVSCSQWLFLCWVWILMKIPELDPISRAKTLGDRDNSVFHIKGSNSGFKIDWAYFKTPYIQYLEYGWHQGSGLEIILKSKTSPRKGWIGKCPSMRSWNPGSHFSWNFFGGIFLLFSR